MWSIEWNARRLIVVDYVSCNTAQTHGSPSGVLQVDMSLSDAITIPTKLHNKKLIAM